MISSEVARLEEKREEGADEAKERTDKLEEIISENKMISE